jgi:PAS domain S-box-containing protein
MSSGVEAVHPFLTEHFAAMPGLGVWVCTPDGKVLFANEAMLRMFGGGSPEELIGRNLMEVYPPDWVGEKIGFLRRVAESGETLMVRCLWQGRLMEAQYKRIDGDEDGPTHVMVIAREGATGEDLLPDDVEVLTSKTSDLGPLSVLSPRELEVLALIGQGRSARQIGELLGLSPRTVERHRDSIGKKLDKNDRVSLALIAQAAGLQLLDATSVAERLPASRAQLQSDRRERMPDLPTERSA